MNFVFLVCVFARSVLSSIHTHFFLSFVCLLVRLFDFSVSLLFSQVAENYYLRKLRFCNLPNASGIRAQKSRGIMLMINTEDNKQ